MKFSYCACLLVALSLMLGCHCSAKRVTAERCNPPMVPSPQGKYCYDFQPNPSKLTWMGAQDFCSAKGGSLITLHSVKEVEFMLRNMAEHKIKSTYLGFRAFMNRTKWRWVDDNTEIDRSVADWAPGQPDFYGSEENCGSTHGFHEKPEQLIKERKILNDISCDQKWANTVGFICKFPMKQRNAKKKRKHNGLQRGDTFHGQNDDGRR